MSQTVITEMSINIPKFQKHLNDNFKIPFFIFIKSPEKTNTLLEEPTGEDASQCAAEISNDSPEREYQKISVSYDGDCK